MSAAHVGTIPLVIIFTTILIITSPLLGRLPLEPKQKRQYTSLDEFDFEESYYSEIIREQQHIPKAKPDETAVRTRTKKRRSLKPRVATIAAKRDRINDNIHRFALALHTTGYLLTITNTEDKRKKKRAIRSLALTIGEVLEEIFL